MTIDDRRILIDRIDDTIIALVKERMQHVSAIRAERIATDSPLVDRQRERVVYERLCASNSGIPSAFIYQIFSSIIETCKRYSTK
jgi:chorismate mutase